MGNSSNGFGSSTTAYEVVDNIKADVSGKVVIITGSNTGIGKETAKALVKAGFGHIVLGCRDVEKMKLAKQEMLKEFSTASIHDLSLDLGDSKSIEKFVSDFQQLNLPLHVLINNAGVMATPQRVTKDGYEYQNGINHLGSFRLTLLLLPIMAKTKGEKRIICVASSAHQMCFGINFDDYHMRQPGSYGPWKSYAQSKVSNIMFASALDRRLAGLFSKDKPDHFNCCSLHPGVITTELQRDLSGFSRTILETSNKLFGKTTQQGAATSVFATLSPSLKGGEYFSDCNLASSTALSRNTQIQDQLFDFSLKETNMTFPTLKKADDE